jgi:hypothetical protein
MARPHKLRLADGSVIELEPADMRSWFEQGLINADTPVQVPGSNTWSTLSRVTELGGGAKRRASASTPARPAAAPVNRAAPPSSSGFSPRGSAPRREYVPPSPWPRRLVIGGAIALALSAVAFTSGWWLPALEKMVASFRGRNENADKDAAAKAEDEAKRRHRLAVQEAAQQLPHLRSDTIELVMARSAVGVLDPSEVFRRAYEAAGRGLPALDRTEAQELSSLNSALSSALSSRERVRLADYIERVRGRRPTSPPEDADMARLVGRAATAMNPTRRARLQALFAKVVASALGAPPPLAQLPGEAGAPAATR